MSADSGIERAIDSITVGTRVRSDLGDLAGLCDSIAEIGLLQPITIAPDGVLLCGYRRLTAVRQLGWRTIKVFVRAGISSDLQRLLAERDENLVRKDFTPIEQARMYAELKAVEAEELARKRALTQFSTERQPGMGHGPGSLPEPSPAESRARAARAVTGRASYHSLERILELERMVADPSTAEPVRAIAATQLETIERTREVLRPYAIAKEAQASFELDSALDDAALPGHLRDEILIQQAKLQTAESNDRLIAIANAAIRRARDARQRPARRQLQEPEERRAPEDPKRWVPRAFTAMLLDTDFWWTHCDPAEIGAWLKPDQWEQFEDWVLQAVEFRNAARPYRRG